MSKTISLLVIGATVAAGLALPAVATAGGSMGGDGTRGAASGRLSGVGGTSVGGSGGTGHGGLAAPAGAEGGSMAAGSTAADSGQAGHGGSSTSIHGNTHSHGDGGAKGAATGFGAAAQGAAPPARGAKPVVVTGTGAGVSSSHLAHGASFAGDLSGHHRHGHLHHHAIPFVFFTGVGTIPVVTETPATEAEDESQSFAVSNETDSEMTVLDNGVRLCVLAPKARCRFATTGGHHDISVRIGGRESSDAAGPGAHGGHMIEVGKEPD